MTTPFTTISGWIEERQAANKRSGSVLISLFADFVVPHGGAVALGSLVEAGALTGISEQTIRSSVNRLAADGWLTTEAMGRRSICRLAETAQKRVQAAIPRVYQCANELWDGQWHLLVANNWKIDPENYTQYVRDLLWSGFGRIADNVFIRPVLANVTVCCDGELKEAILNSMVCFEGTAKGCIQASSIDELINKAWDLTTVQARYQVFIDNYEELLAAIWKSPRIPGAQAFAIRSMMIHDFRRIRLLDPGLPTSLFPTGWNGERAFYIAHELYDLLMPSSEQFIMEVMQGPDGRIPFVESSFYDRFGGLTRN